MQLRILVHEREKRIFTFAVFSISLFLILFIDVIEVLVGGDRPRKYWNDLKKKLFQEGYDQLSEKIGQLKFAAAYGTL